MKKLLALLLLPISTSVYSLPPIPTKCPDVIDLQLAGLSNNLARDANGHWYAGRTSRSYNTNVKWTFAIGGIVGDTKTDALAEAYEALQTMTYFSGPTFGPSNKWICSYQNGEELPTGAVSPPISTFGNLYDFLYFR